MAAIVGGLGVVLVLLSQVLPVSEDTGTFGGATENTIVESDPTSAAIMTALALVVAWRVYRTYTEREKPIWILVPAVFIAINLAVVWNSALTLYPLLPDGSLDTSAPTSASAGIALYIAALGVLFCLASGAALWNITGAPLSAAWRDRQQVRSYEGPAAGKARLEAEGAWGCTLCGSQATGSHCRACGAERV